LKLNILYFKNLFIFNIYLIYNKIKLKVKRYINAKYRLNEDKLYDEMDLVKLVQQELTNNDELSVDQKWVKVFKTACFSELPKLVGQILSVPVSNAFTERVFSLMGNLWTDERNCLSIQMVKAVLCTKINYNMSCSDFIEFLKNKEQDNLLKSCQKNSKYDFAKNY